MLTVSLADYGVGNLHSLRKALEDCGAKVITVSDMNALMDAECIAFPGVGAFDKTMEGLIPFRDRIIERLDAGVPCIGICIGMQIMMKGSDEGTSPGVGFIDGRVVRMKAERVPHMGWNTVETDDPLMEGVGSRYFYFAHSYHGDVHEDNVVKGTTRYENISFPVLFRKKNFVGSQFHPEKSSVSGMQFLKNFITFAEESK